MTRTYDASPAKPLNYDIDTVARMINTLAKCPDEQRLDSLAMLVKLFIEGDISRIAERRSHARTSQ